jgi:hypothetical protein
VCRYGVSKYLNKISKGAKKDGKREGDAGWGKRSTSLSGWLFCSPDGFLFFCPVFFFSVCAAAVCSRLHASLTVPMGFVDVDTGQTREILPMIHMYLAVTNS